MQHKLVNTSQLDRRENSYRMVRLSIAFLLVILCCATYSFAAVTTDKWQQELEMKLDDKINKVEARNVQLEEKVNQLENQRILDVSSSFIFNLFLLFLVYCWTDKNYLSIFQWNNKMHLSIHFYMTGGTKKRFDNQSQATRGQKRPTRSQSWRARKDFKFSFKSGWTSDFSWWFGIVSKYPSNSIKPRKNERNPQDMQRTQSDQSIIFIRNAMDRSGRPRNWWWPHLRLLRYVNRLEINFISLKFLFKWKSFSIHFCFKDPLPYYTTVSLPSTWNIALILDAIPV